MLLQGQHILDVAKKAELSAGYDHQTGLHLESWETTQETPYNNCMHFSLISSSHMQSADFHHFILSGLTSYESGEQSVETSDKSKEF